MAFRRIHHVLMTISIHQSDRSVEATWRESKNVCALADEHRHLGHAIRAGGWVAFNGTRLNAEQSGFLCLGRFETLMQAKEAVEISLAAAQHRRTMTAGTSY